MSSNVIPDSKITASAAIRISLTEDRREEKKRHNKGGKKTNLKGRIRRKKSRPSIENR